MDWRVVVAFLFGALSILLSIVISEGDEAPTTFDAHCLHTGRRVAWRGACRSVTSFGTSHGNRRAIRGGWPVRVALDGPLLGIALIALIVEPHELSALDVVAIALLGVATSLAGAALAARGARP